MTREMTERQFNQALERNGFRRSLLWLEDTTGQTGTHYGMIIDSASERVYLRESLAHAITARAKEAASIKQAGKLVTQGLDAQAIAAKMRIGLHLVRLYIGKAKERGLV